MEESNRREVGFQSGEAAGAAAARSLLEVILGSWKAQAVRVAAELKLPDLLAAGPLDAETLAARTNTDPPSLHRLLRALATLGVVRELPGGWFENTEMGTVLRSDVPDSLRCWSIWWGTNLWTAWGNLDYSVRTGRSARTLTTGQEGFGHLEADPATAAVFNQAMVELTRLVADSVVRAYAFGGIRTLVDVGGGHGELMRAILLANPEVHGWLLDRPHALEGARAHLEAAGLSGRCECRAVDFWESIPSGGDAYLMKSILHDWNDEASRRLLGICRRAMGDGARLLVVERIRPVVPGQSREDQDAARSDLMMLVAHGARERTEPEFRELLGSAGFRISGIHRTDGPFSVIEAWPA